MLFNINLRIQLFFFGQLNLLYWAI